MRILRRAIEGSIYLFGRVRKRRRIAISISDEFVKVNIGCGLAVAPGWINIDGSFNALVANIPESLRAVCYRFTGSKHYYSKEEYLNILRNNRFIHHDLSFGLPLPDVSVQYIYSSHFLEHLPRNDAMHLLEDCYRVLKPGGIARITIPDLEYAISLYANDKKEKMLSSYFFVEDDGSSYARHKYMYDFIMLSEMLVKIGFKDVMRCSYREGNIPDIQELDNRPEDSLYVEAEK